MTPLMRYGAALSDAWARWAPPANAVLALTATGLLALYAALGEPKPWAHWNALDIAGEGGSALMAAVWCVMVLGSRPGGRVTALLATGLAMISLGNWADCLDEFFRIPPDMVWDNLLEAALMPGGMLVLTVGILGWRTEQRLLREHLRQRERLYRDHRGFDRVTQLADASYLRQLAAMERRANPGQACALLMLDADQLSSCLREHGQAESDRLLQALSHLLLLNLRPDDVLCRFAGDRFAVLLPATDASTAGRLALHLQQAVASLGFYTSAGRPIGSRRPCVAHAEIGDEDRDPVDCLVASLNRHRAAGRA
jgi:diguanylate cyclase (GGDEF)-like protein